MGRGGIDLRNEGGYVLLTELKLLARGGLSPTIFV
jgi:hypothetical protein